jgi:hypothetical protein
MTARDYIETRLGHPTSTRTVAHALGCSQDRARKLLAELEQTGRYRVRETRAGAVWEVRT